MRTTGVEMMQQVFRTVVVASALVLAGVPSSWAGPLQDDLAARRSRFMAQLGADTLAIVDYLLGLEQ